MHLPFSALSVGRTLQMIFFIFAKEMHCFFSVPVDNFVLLSYDLYGLDCHHHVDIP